MKPSTLMWTRRRVLRGMLAGGAVTVGLPIFDCLLNDNGTAFADTGAPLPTRFATWFWALGLGRGGLASRRMPAATMSCRRSSRC